MNEKIKLDDWRYLIPFDNRERYDSMIFEEIQKGRVKKAEMELVGNRQHIMTLYNGVIFGGVFFGLAEIGSKLF